MTDGATRISSREYHSVYPRHRADYFSASEVLRILEECGLEHVTLHEGVADLDTTASGLRTRSVQSWIEGSSGVFCISVFFRLSVYTVGDDGPIALRVYRSEDDWFWACVYHSLFAIDPISTDGKFWRCDGMRSLLAVIRSARSDESTVLGIV